MPAEGEHFQAILRALFEGIVEDHQSTQLKVAPGRAASWMWWTPYLSSLTGWRAIGVHGEAATLVSTTSSWLRRKDVLWAGRASDLEYVDRHFASKLYVRGSEHAVYFSPLRRPTAREVLASP